jgi:ankyrin repeat protein
LLSQDHDIEQNNGVLDPFELACGGCFMPVIALLSKKPELIDINKVIDEEQGLTLLHCAAYYGKLNPVRALVEKFNADLNKKDYRGSTPLHVAVLTKHSAVAIYLGEKMTKNGTDLHKLLDNASSSPLLNSVIASDEISLQRC